MRVEATLGDHVREDRIGETTDNPQHEILRQQHDADVVNRHRDQREYFELVSRHVEGYSIVSRIENETRSQTGTRRKPPGRNCLVPVWPAQ